MFPFQAEGKEISKDFSYEWVQGHPDLIAIEKGIPISQFSESLLKRDLEMEFRLLRRLTETQYHNDNLYDFHPDILSLNRYNNILPFKHSIVKLSTDADEEENLKESYINANFINLLNGKERMIVATQGPLQKTISHFWRMVVQENLSMIVMLCNLRENTKAQCEQYWPKNVGENLITGGITVKLENCEDLGNSLTRRTLKVSEGEVERIVQQIQWCGWADQGVPQPVDFAVILQMLTFILEELDQDRKVIFHCSAGVGRTGTLISLTNLMILLREYKKYIADDDSSSFNQDLELKENPELYRLSIFGTVRRLREQRWGMVHTSEQYIYIYKFIDEAIKQLF